MRIRINSSNSVVLCYLILLFSSFDIILNFNIFGFNLRIAQLLIVIAFFYVCPTKLIINKDYITFYIWLSLQLISIIYASNYFVSIAYFFWLILCVLIVRIFRVVFTTQYKVEKLIKLYINSFVVLSVIGLIQGVLSILGIDFFMAQDSLNGSIIPRLNAFTYEPSYYATYLLPGWIFVGYLFERGSEIIAKKELKKDFIIISIALFLSTSRMGWICMCLWLLYRLVVFVFEPSHKKEKKRVVLMTLVVILIAFFICLVYSIIQKYGFDFIFGGLGIGGTSTHSSGVRITQLKNTFEIFKKHPILGVGLGGVPVEYCLMQNIAFDSGASMCVWMEVLAASGIVGSCFLLISFIKLIKNGIKVIRKHNLFCKEISGLIYATIFEIIILAMNQNILRIYFWTLIAVMCTVINFSIRKKDVKDENYC